MGDEETRYFISILDTRPGGKTHGIMVRNRKDVESTIFHDDFFDFLPGNQTPGLARAARKVKQGNVIEFPKGIFLGLSSIVFTKDDFDFTKKENESPKPAVKKPSSGKSVKVKKPAPEKSTKVKKPASKGRSRAPKVTKTSKGIFLVEDPSDTQLKKLRKGVKTLGGGVRKSPGKDDYIVTIPKGGTIKGLKEIISG